MSFVSKKIARMKVVVSFFTAIVLFLSSTPVLAAIAAKCCMKKQMHCNMAKKMEHGKKHTCPMTKQISTNNEYAPAKSESPHHSSDPVSCCEKNCYPQIAKSKQLVNKKADLNSVAKFIQLLVTVELMQTEEISFCHIKSGPLILNSQPLYSLNSAYLI